MSPFPSDRIARREGGSAEFVADDADEAHHLAGVPAEVVGERQATIGVRDRALYVFFGRRRTALKIVYFDGSGLCILYKRLDRGAFRIPTSFDEHARVLEIDDRVLEDLLAGVDIEVPTKH